MDQIVGATLLMKDNFTEMTWNWQKEYTEMYWKLDIVLKSCFNRIIFLNSWNKPG